MIALDKFKKICINFLIGFIAIGNYFLCESSEQVFLNLSLVSMISFIVILFTSGQPISSPYSIFMIVLHVYNCGQVWLNYFGVPIIPGNYTITRYSNDLLSDSMLFFIFSVLSINVCFIKKANRGKASVDHIELKTREYEEPNQNIVYIVTVLFLICLYYDFGQYRIAASSGYAAALYARANNELLYMCNCAFPFFVFWALRSNISPRSKTIIFITSAARYVATTVLIGYRMQAISFVLASIVLLYETVQEENKKKVTILMVSGIIAASFLSIVAANLRRGVSSTGVFEMYNAFIQELGGTFIDLPIIIRDVDEIGAAYGLTYACAALYLLPFVGHFIPGMSKYVNLSAILYTRITIYGDSSLGGSMLAEFFYNFKWGSIFIASPIVGWVFGEICNTLNKNKNNSYKATMLAYIFYIFLLYSRGNIGEITIYIRCAVCIAGIHWFLRSCRYPSYRKGR